MRRSAGSENVRNTVKAAKCCQLSNEFTTNTWTHRELSEHYFLCLCGAACGFMIVGSSFPVLAQLVAPQLDE